MRRTPGLLMAILLGATAAVGAPTVGPAHAAISTIDLVTPTGSGQFGYRVFTLSNGNFVINDPYADGLRGAVHLYDGVSNTLISTLRGSTVADRIGWERILEVGDSNFIVSSPYWINGAATGAGAVTWVNGTTGLDGAVSPSNSLVGTTTDDSVGSYLTVVLSNGNYIVTIPDWGAPNLGAVTWGDGAHGVVGPVSAANSLVGTQTGDIVAVDVDEVANSNAVLKATLWDSPTAANAGAVTWINGEAGITGTISSANSLVGTTADDLVGQQAVVLTNGNYVVTSPMWNDGTTANVGAATWVNGTQGLTGPVSTANSLVGQAADDYVSYNGVTALTNGNYVVKSGLWHNGPLAMVGATTWGNGASGTTGVVSAANSIHGTYLLDTVDTAVALENGNYVVSSPLLDVNGMQNVGAAIWASGTGPTAIGLDDTNSIIGSTAGDRVGRVTALTNGNYVVQSDWQTGGVVVGASTWATGTERSAFSVSATNSLVNAQLGDNGNSRVVPLTNGNYLVAAAFWANGTSTRAGAVTWGSGTSAISGIVSDTNSFVGGYTDDWVGAYAAALPNGNAVISSALWDAGMTPDAGMVRIMSGSEPTSGPVTATNSLYGLNAGDRVGGLIDVLPDGNVVTRAPMWDNELLVDAGAVTWLSANGGPTGPITASNSIIGTHAGDQVGANDLEALPDSSYVFESLGVDNGANLQAGAVTYVDPGGAVGTLSAANSVFGEQPNQGGQNPLGDRYTKADGVVIGRPVDNKVTVIVTRDKTPPSFAPAANLVVPAPPGAHSTVVDYPLPIATDARSTPIVACSPAAGSVFPVGLTTVSCVATDGVGLTATTTFTVTVTSTDDYVPLPPSRIADTRPGFKTIDGIDAGAGQRELLSTLELQVAGRGGVAPDASAVTLNVTAVDAVAPGFATVWPCGEPRPTASNLNFATGATVPNAVIAKIGAGGKVCLFTSQPIHLVVDVNGYAPATTSYRPLNPARLLDTRGDGVTVDGSQQRVGLAGADSTTTLQVRGRGGVPADATSVVLNLTTTESVADGYITAYPCDSDRPNASSVNGVAGATVANLVIAKISPSGTVCLFSQSPTHLIADVNGYFAPGGSYVPLVPARLMDTRSSTSGTTTDGQFAGAGSLALGTITRLTVNGRGGVPDASTVVLNVTVTEPGAAGYVTVYPCGIEPPNASNLNYATGQTVANGVLVKVGTGATVCLYNSQPTHLVVDVTGYFPT